MRRSSHAVCPEFLHRRGQTVLAEKNGAAVPHQVVWQAGFGDQSVPDEPKKKSAVYDANAKFTRVAITGTPLAIASSNAARTKASSRPAGFTPNSMKNSSGEDSGGFKMPRPFHYPASSETLRHSVIPSLQYWASGVTEPSAIICWI